MKQLSVLMILAFFLGACSITRKSKPNVIQITVIDKENNSPIDSAQVVLVSVIDSRDVYKDIKYTGKYGLCRFSTDYNPLAQYQVRTEKNGYIGYFDGSYSLLDRAWAFIDENTGDDIVLYLTSDTMNHENYWASVTTRYEIKTLINLLKSNQYPLRSEFPLLWWEDIPELLAIGNNNILINKYPISVVSSSYQKDCYLGIIALWFIESIRISELKNTLNPNEKFPSLTPSLHYIGAGNPDPASNSIEIMEKAYQAYVTWWDKVKYMDEEHACKINPMENTNMEW
jgi:hypothetical protein